MKFKFQTFMDVSTSASSMQILQFSVGGKEVINRARHLFGAYKYFKLGKISVKMVPASTLPVDPLQLSYDLDDPQSVDPRDQMNPGLVRITNGEDVFTDVSSLDADAQLRQYQTMMLDPRWSKFMLQSGFRRSAYPLYWQVGQLSQDAYPGAIINPPTVANSTVSPQAPQAVYKRSHVRIGTSAYVYHNQGSSARGLFQVGHKGRLGFLPTDFYQDIPVANDGSVVSTYGVNAVPEVSVITCVLPKAYKTLYYYRIFITEEVIFSGLRSAPYGAPGLDNFVIGQPYRYNPGSSTALSDVSDVNQNTGGTLP